MGISAFYRTAFWLSQLFIHSILYLFSEDLLIPSRSQRMCWDEGYPVEEVPVHMGALVDDDIYWTIRRVSGRKKATQRMKTGWRCKSVTVLNWVVREGPSKEPLSESQEGVRYTEGRGPQSQRWYQTWYVQETERRSLGLGCGGKIRSGRRWGQKCG